MTAGHWNAIAENWRGVGPPLRPSAADLAVYAKFAARSHRPLILGVTPELFRLFPENADIIALDHTKCMIDTVWPGSPETALLADWRDMPLPAAARDLALCDGGLPLNAYPAAQTAIAAEIARVIGRGGYFVTRLFIPPAVHESADEVCADLLAGRIASVDLLKVRLWAALQSDPAAGVSLGAVWDRIYRDISGPELSGMTGWPPEAVATLESYRGETRRYHLVTIAQARELFAAAFTLKAVHVPHYSYGERFPILVFSKN